MRTSVSAKGSGKAIGQGVTTHTGVKPVFVIGAPRPNPHGKDFSRLGGRASGKQDLRSAELAPSISGFGGTLNADSESKNWLRTSPTWPATFAIQRSDLRQMRDGWLI